MLSRILSIVAILAVVCGGVYYKVGVINKKNARVEVTIASIQAEKGIPVYADEVRFGNLPKYFKPTIKVLSSGKASILVPADTRSFVEKMKNAAIYIEDKKYIAYEGSLSAKAMDYTGFIEVIAKIKPALPWPVGTIKVGRAPYDFDKKYLYVPLESLYRGANGYSVYVIKEGIIHLKPVELLFTTHQHAAIAPNGVKVGDRLVISDQRDLVEGDKAHIIERN